jgi:ubiquinone/menaquinone biosynthesis C-methylase UbiE
LADLDANLADIRFLNRWFGGTEAAWTGVRSLSSDEDRLCILDVATGSADIPVGLWERAARINMSLEITGLDASTEVLTDARKIAARIPIRLVQADARALPWPPDSFDVVLCCLALHHFDPRDARQVLREMWRTCRRGIVVTDLTRGYVSLAATWLVTRTLARNRVTRHDGPLSVLRAYTPAELRQMAAESGIVGADVRRHSFFRQVLVARKPCSR